MGVYKGMKKVVKFGGSSLASAEQFKKVGAIIRQEESRRYVVPSAPGKRFSGDTKVTDMLYSCYHLAIQEEDFDEQLDAIKARYQEIIDGLKLDLSLDQEFKVIRENFSKKVGRDYAASRGEYLNGMIMAAYLGYEFIDAAEVIFFNEKGGFDFNGLETLLLESEEFLGIMATNKTEPTVITVGTEISSNGSTETPKPEEPVVPEKTNYIIPDSIKDAIDSTVIKPVTGTGVVNKPLILDITGASLSDVKSMFEKLSNFTVSVSMLKTRSNEVQYSVLLTSANESISLILTVDTNQSDVISYLNSFIKDTSKPDDSKPETPKPEENTNSTTQSSTTTNKPATGYTLMGWMTLGVFSTLLGFVSYIKRNKNDKKQVK